MPTLEETVRERISAALVETEGYFGRGKWFMIAVGLVVVFGGIAREILWLSAIGLVFFGGLTCLMIATGKRTRERPIRRVLLEQPERIRAIGYRKTSSSSGAFPSHWLTFRDEGGDHIALRFELGVIEALAPMLARYFTQASIEIPGYAAKAGVSSPP